MGNWDREEERCLATSRFMLRCLATSCVTLRYLGTSRLTLRCLATFRVTLRCVATSRIIQRCLVISCVALRGSAASRVSPSLKFRAYFPKNEVFSQKMIFFLVASALHIKSPGCRLYRVWSTLYTQMCIHFSMITSSTASHIHTTVNEIVSHLYHARQSIFSTEFTPFSVHYLLHQSWYIQPDNHNQADDSYREKSDDETKKISRRLISSGIRDHC